MEIKINHEPFIKLKEGVDEIANTVKATLGPCGKNVLIDLKNNAFYFLTLLQHLAGMIIFLCPAKI